jgi:hypothetical protein
LDSKNDGTIKGEVHSRLEDLFGENEKPPDLVVNNGNPEDFPIIDLKANILSIEWEISDEILAALIEEIDRLKITYKDDKNLLLFFHLLGSVGKYIKKRKVNAHPDAIKLLNSVYNSLEHVLLSKDISEKDKRQTLLAQVEEFKKLKEQIALSKADEPKKKKVEPPEDVKPVVAAKVKDKIVQVEPLPSEEPRAKLPLDKSNMTPQEALAYVLAEVKHIIRTEFKALKEELKS